MTTLRVSKPEGENKKTVMPIVERGKRTKIDSIQASIVNNDRRDKTLRWTFWTFFLLATMCAFAWKMAYASAA